MAHKWYALAALLVAACSDATSPTAPTMTAYARLDAGWASLKATDRTQIFACSVDIPTSANDLNGTLGEGWGHNDNAACWAAMLKMIGAASAATAACGKALSLVGSRRGSVMYAAFAGCAASVGITVETIESWWRTKSSDGHRDWSDHYFDNEMERQTCLRLGRDGC